MLVPVLLASASGCAASNQIGEPTTTRFAAPATNSALAERVPATIRDAGVLAIATDPNYPPMEQRIEGRLEGVDIDIATAVAAILGLSPALRETQFSNVIPAVAINQYEIGISAMWVDGQRSRYVDMISYLRAGKELAVRVEPNAPEGVGEQLCGRRVAVEEGTEAIDTMAAVSSTCREAGAKPVRITASLSQAAATSLLVSGAVDAMFADGPVVSYAVAQSQGALRAAGEPVDPRPYGIAVNQDQDPLAQTVRDAVQELIDSGLYLEILRYWGLEKNAITESALQPASATFANRGREDASDAN